MKSKNLNHGYKTQSKLWKQFLKYAMSIKPSELSRQRRDNSTCKFQSQMTFRLCTSFRKLEFHNNRGIALITVILIISIIVAIAIELNRSTRAAIYDAANLSDGIKLIYIAKSGFYGAAALLSDASNDCITLRDNWAQAEMLSAQSRTLFADGYFTAIVEDETGKIPLNKLVNGNEYDPVIKEILIRLLTQDEFGLDDKKVYEIVDSLKDWIDADNSASPYGAESSYYSSLDPPYEAKNAKLDCIEELLMVKGITSEIFYGTKDKPGLAAFITADSDGLININTAPKMVLRALADSITVELADKIDEYRRKEGNDLSNSLWYKKVAGMAGVTIKPELIVVKSNYFKIISTGKMNNMEQSVNSVVKRSGKSVQIIKWRQD